MPRRFLAVFFILILAIGGVLLWQNRPVQHSSEPLSHRAYVWQRVQNAPEVSAAINSVPDFVDGLLPLVAEMHFRNGPENPPEIVRPTLAVVSFRTRAETKIAHDAAVIRIGTSAAGTGWNPESCQLVSDLAREFLASRIWVPEEIQIDYDCPQKKLADYTRLIAHLRDQFPIEKLSFTALPSWLKEPEFPRLAGIADSYVLQVHSLQLPDSPDQRVELINFDLARDAISLAGRIGRNFEVALPTYSCFVIFEADGNRVFDVVSEDLPRQWPRNTGPIRLGRTDSALSSLLVSDLQRSHPRVLSGIIWYRLPVESDVMNWNRTVWEKVARGKRPISKIEIESIRPEGRPMRTELFLKNTGETAVALPEIIRLKIEGSGEYQFDGGRLYLGKGDPLEFHLIQSKIDPLPLPAGKSVKVGWIEGQVEVLAELP